MNFPDWARDDEVLLAHIRDALIGDDQVTVRMREAAKAAYSWRTVDEELELLMMSADSALEGTLGVRGSTTSDRMVSFTGTTFNVEIEIGDDMILGQLYPVGSGMVTLTTAAGLSAETNTDDIGFFMIARPAQGPVRLRCAIAGVEAITEWISLS